MDPGVTPLGPELTPQLDRLMASGNAEDVELVLRDRNARQAIHDYASGEDGTAMVERLIAHLDGDHERALAFFPGGPVHDLITSHQAANGGQADPAEAQAASAQRFMERLDSGSMTQLQGAMEDPFTEIWENGVADPLTVNNAYGTEIGSYARTEGDELVIDIPYHLVATGADAPSQAQLREMAASAVQGMSAVNARTGQVTSADGVERTIRFNPVYIEDPAMALQIPGCHRVNAHGGTGRANAANYYYGGQLGDGSDVPITLAHELLHSGVGLLDNYQEGPWQRTAQLDGHGEFTVTRSTDYRANEGDLHLQSDDGSIMGGYYSSLENHGETQASRRHEVQVGNLVRRAEAGEQGMTVRAGSGGIADLSARSDRVRSGLAAQYVSGGVDAATRIPTLERIERGMMSGSLDDATAGRALDAAEAGDWLRVNQILNEQ